MQGQTVFIKSIKVAKASSQRFCEAPKKAVKKLFICRPQPVFKNENKSGKKF